MKRFVSVWLPAWPIERFARTSPAAVSPSAPLALVEDQGQARVVTAVTGAALRQGVRPGMALSDARAILPGLLVRAADPLSDTKALRRLARWCSRYGPSCNIDPGMARMAGEHGAWIDVTNVAHLFGGERALLDDLARRLAQFGFSARLGLADTYGAAHALARHASVTPAIAPPGGTRAAIACLPAAGLRLTPDTLRLLNRLGLRRIGDLYDLPRPALERRFHEEAGARRRCKARAEAPHLAGRVLARLDMALGIAAEPLRPLGPKPALAVRRSFPEPLISAAGIEAAAADAAAALCADLDAAGLGARRIRLSLYRCDGTLARIEVGMSAPCRSAPHMLRLVAERLAAIDAGFGIDLVVMEVLRAVSQPPAQGDMPATAAHGPGGDVAGLVDVLAGRLGEERVAALAPRASHIPERSQARIAVDPAGLSASAVAAWPLPDAGCERPPLLLARPEPIAVMAEVPEGPPRQFTWRRLAHRVARAEGPERIAPEWWRHLPAPVAGDAGDDAACPASARLPPTRDYYRVEVDGGGRYWIFRDGLYGDEGPAPPRWFLHGLYG
jgi:protein ImuB